MGLYRVNYINVYGEKVTKNVYADDCNDLYNKMDDFCGNNEWNGDSSSITKERVYDRLHDVYL